MGKTSTIEDQRKGIRKPIIGEILWSYASDQDEDSSKGVMIDESASGMGILTINPVEVGSILRICCKNRNVRYDSMRRCKEEDNYIYRSGPLFPEQWGYLLYKFPSPSSTPFFYNPQTKILSQKLDREKRK
ncbi:MAG TPA: hypothetical protein DCP92_04575 [Nitrospiraceae bacterium]|nr:hypothetical protein [Nitrospiraceae bacterium]